MQSFIFFLKFYQHQGESFGLAWFGLIRGHMKKILIEKPITQLLPELDRKILKGMCTLNSWKSIAHILGEWILIFGTIILSEHFRNPILYLPRFHQFLLSHPHYLENAHITKQGCRGILRECTVASSTTKTPEPNTEGYQIDLKSRHDREESIQNL